MYEFMFCGYHIQVPTFAYKTTFGLLNTFTILICYEDML